jgi:hypothetical protein
VGWPPEAGNPSGPGWEVGGEGAGDTTVLVDCIAAGSWVVAPAAPADSILRLPPINTTGMSLTGTELSPAWTSAKERPVD